MAEIIECVPNFSEGKQKDVIDAIAKAIKDTEGCTLLDIESETSTNRSVYTFVGNSHAVVQGALNGAQVAYSLIDMSKHTGVHPRMGALDVCPFIPVSNATMDDCVKCSKVFGSKLADILHVPVYLYEYSCERGKYRKTLPQIRAGEYEGLKDKIVKPEWVPDYGPSSFVPCWGATVTGARQFLIAYNVNIISTKQQAHRIALNVREQGRSETEPGRLKSVKAIGWYLDDRNIAQVSINLTDFKTTPIHIAYEECKKDAKTLKLPVVGSEIVGLVPLQAILMAAEYYIEKENLFILTEDQKIMLAVERLGLNSLSHFDPRKKIIELCIGQNNDGPLLKSSIRQFVESISARTPTPGGGSASACICSIGTALATMVGLMTYGKRQYESLDESMREVIPPLYNATQQLLNCIDADTAAFTMYMDALKLSHKSEEETTRRTEVIQESLKKAVNVPLDLMRKVHSCWPHILVLAENGNVQTLSDLQVCVKSLETGSFGGYCNILINLKDIKDLSFTDSVKNEVESLWKEAQDKSILILSKIQGRLASN